MKRIITIAAALLLGTGCMHSHVDENWGQSQPTLAAQQIENPEASDVKTPVEGMGATTADHVTENYHVRQQEQAHEDGTESLLDLID